MSSSSPSFHGEASSLWKQAIDEYFSLVDISSDEKRTLLEAKSAAEVVSKVLRSQAYRAKRGTDVVANQLFIAAVASAGTHDQLIRELEVLRNDKVPIIVSHHVATFLRYAGALDVLLGSLTATSFPSVFIFGAVRVLLAIVVKDLKLLIDIKDQFEDFIMRLNRLDIYLSLKEPTEAVKMMCVRVLVDILRFCGLATMYFKSTYLTLQPFDEIESRFRMSAKLKTDLEGVIHRLDRDTVIEIATGIVQLNSAIERLGMDLQTKRSAHSLSRPLTDSEILSILDDWLQPATVEEDHQFLDRNHYLPGTCEWIRRNASFQTWMQGSPGEALWIHGFPGSGKSVLSAYIISILRENTEAITAYFFCHWNEPEKRTALSTLRTIVSQFAHQIPFYREELFRLYNENINLSQPLPLLWKSLFLQPFSKVTNRIQMYIVVDGLDECNDEARQAIIEFLLPSETSYPMSSLIVSRYYSNIPDQLSSRPTIILEPDGNSHDLNAYIDYCVGNSRVLKRAAIKSDVVKTLYAQARGNFLWVKLIVRELDKQRTEQGILALLRSLPLEMKDMYKRILEMLDQTLSDEGRLLTSAVFGWTACARRPLTIPEMTQAIELSRPEIQGILDLQVVLQEDCGGLVTVFASSIQFMHQTVSQYIPSSRLLESFGVRETQMHLAASKACLAYLSDPRFAHRLSFDRFEVAAKDKLLEEHPFLSYASIFWPHHLSYTTLELNTNNELATHLLAFLKSGNLLVAMEAAVTFGSLDALHEWTEYLGRVYSICSGMGETAVFSMIKLVIVDLHHILRHYGHILESFPNEIHHIIDESFPQNSHFWRMFGHHMLSTVEGQWSEWDPCIARLQHVHVNCIAVDPLARYFAVADKSTTYIISLRSWLEICKFPTESETTNIALSFDNRGLNLALLSNDGSVTIVSTLTWQKVKVLTSKVSLPEVILHWNDHQFWNYYFLHFSPVHVNLEWLDDTHIIAGNNIVDSRNDHQRQVFSEACLRTSVTEFAFSKSGIIAHLSATGKLTNRTFTIGGLDIPHRRSVHQLQPDNNGPSKRLLAISHCGQLLAICSIEVYEEFGVSGSVLECIDTGNYSTLRLPGKFGNDYRLTAATFGDTGHWLAASAHNSQRLVDTTMMWRTSGIPQLVWKQTLFDEHSTAISFAMNDSIFIKAGRNLRAWHIDDIEQTRKQRTGFQRNLALKLSPDGKMLASAPGEAVLNLQPRIIIYHTDSWEKREPSEIPWPNHLPVRNIYVTDPLAFSRNSNLIAWDIAIFSTGSLKLVAEFPLHAKEKVCRMGGFSYDSGVVVYGIDRRPPRLRRREIPLTQVTSFKAPEPPESATQYVVLYNLSTRERRVIFSTAELLLIQPHPSNLLVGVVVRDEMEIQGFKLFTLSINPVEESSTAAISVTPSFLFGDSVNISFAHVATLLSMNKARDSTEELGWLGGAWRATHLINLMSDTRPLQQKTLAVPVWHVLPAFESGRVVYFLQDGCIALFDPRKGLRRIKYLPSQFQWSMSHSCVTANEMGGIIRIAIQSLSVGVFWFDVYLEEALEG